MSNNLSQWFASQFPRTASPLNRRGELLGWVYVAEHSTTAMAYALTGRLILEDAPGGILVDQSPENLVLENWPGKLWQVRVLQPAVEQPLAYRGFLRARSVQVVAQFPLRTLFGFQGDAIVAFLDSLPGMTRTQAETLKAKYQSSSNEIVNLVWNRWLLSHEPQSLLIGQDHVGLLARHYGGTRSPIGPAARVLFSIVEREAHRHRDMPEAGSLLPPEPWHSAACQLLGELFYLACPAEFLDPKCRAILAQSLGAQPYNSTVAAGLVAGFSE